jgi:hypothetical protein
MMPLFVFDDYNKGKIEQLADIRVRNAEAAIRTSDT